MSDDPHIQEPPPPHDAKRLTTSDERTLSMFAHLLPIIGAGFVGPLIVYLVKRNESEFVADHARDSLNFQITVIIAMFVSIPLVYACIGIPMVMAIGICDLVFCILGAVAANNGDAYSYPISIPFVRR